MSHMSLMHSSSLTNLSSASPVLFSAMANLWLNTCSFWLFYCLILNFSFDIFYHFRVFAQFFISFSIYLKKPPNQTLCQLNPLSMSLTNLILSVRFWFFGFRGVGVGVWSNGMFQNFWWNAGYWNMKYFRDNLKLWIFFPPSRKICFWHVVRLEADLFNPVRDLADSRLDFTHCKADLCCSPFLLKHRPSKIPAESLGVYKGLSILVGPGLLLLSFPAWDYRKFWVSFLASQATAEVRESLPAASVVALPAASVYTSLARTLSYGYP